MSDITLFLDIETFCETPIKQGTHRYAEGAEVILVQVAIDDDPVQVWDTTDPERRKSQMAALQGMIDGATRVVIHNSAFERTVLRQHGVTIPVEKIDDTMVLALQHGLPGGLGQLCDILGVPTDKAKDKAGKKLIQLFTKPRPKNVKLRRATKETHPDEWDAFVEYARLDVDAMREVYRRLPRFNDSVGERELWRLDQRINDRGFAVDVEHARSALRAFDGAARSLGVAASALTSGALQSTTQRDALLQYLKRELGFDLDNLQKDTVSKVLAGELPPEVRELLENRQEAAATSPSKYRALLGAVSSDNRLRGTLQFCGAARTGRDAGRIFQPQNLPRTPDWFDLEVQELTVQAFKAGVEDLLFDDIVDRCSFAVRGCLIPADGHQLLVSDLSNIEGRTLAWLAGEQWKIEAFRAYDRGEGHDLYKVTAGRILGKDPADVAKTERQNQGKVPELACLGPDTQVLTNNGVKLITEVSTADLVWDGMEWVAHEGLVSRGVKRVGDLLGVEMTPDHRVLVGETWLPARMASSCPSFLDLALATGAASWKSLASTLAAWAASLAFSCAAPAEMGLTPSMSATGARGAAPDATPAPNAPQAEPARRGSGTLLSSPTTPTDGGCVTASPPASADATTPMTLRTKITAAEASSCMARGERIAPPFSRISSPSTGGMPRSLNSTGSTLTGATSPGICVSSPSARTETTSAVSPSCSDGLTNWKPVYDLADAGPRNRFTILCNGGHLVVHNCGYQGSVGAFRKMGGAVASNMSDDDILEIVNQWRAAHPRTKSLWYEMERAAKAAIENPGDSFEVRGLIRFDVVRDAFGVDWMRMRLPSGRSLVYCRPKLNREECYRCDGTGRVPFVFNGADREMVCPECNGAGQIGSGQVSYEGVNQYTRQWCRLDTYGGKLTENAVQAIARDVFFSGLKRAEAAGYGVVLRVHDELVCEVPLGDPHRTAEGLGALMSTNDSWNAGLPLAAAGEAMMRYGKT